MTRSHGRIAVATITLARDPEEADLLQRSINALAAARLPIAIADGGSPHELTTSLRSLPGVTLVRPDASGLVPQVNAAVGAAAATGAEFVLYTESDKLVFFEEQLPAFLEGAPLGDETGVVLASRTNGGFATFPPIQQFVEGTINTLTGDFVRLAGDYSYGPFLMHCALAPFVGGAAPELGWGWRHHLFAVAHRLGRRITHIVDDFECPQDQRDEDDLERVHRLRQLAQNVNGLVSGMTVGLP